MAPPSDTPSDTDVLLAQIEAACRELKIAQTTFGRLAVNDGKLVTRLQQGARVTVATVDRVHRFIAAQGGADASALRSAIRGLHPARPAGFRARDRLRDQLAFVAATTEKQVIADHALAWLAEAQPQPPAIRLFDAHVGEGTTLVRLLRGMHRRHPTAPFYVVARTGDAADARLVLERMADRLAEHPATVIVLTNLPFAEALRLKPQSAAAASRMIWNEVALDGGSAAAVEEELAALDPWLDEHWRARAGESAKPMVLVLYRRDHRFVLEPVLPRRGLARADFDLILVAQAWRAAAPLAFRSARVVAPLLRGLRANGLLVGVQGCGGDGATALVEAAWPDEKPFPITRAALLAQVADDLGPHVRDFHIHDLSDAQAVLRYRLRDTGADEAAVAAAWSAATHAAQIDEQRVDESLAHGLYRSATHAALASADGLWFADEQFVIARRPRL